MIFRYVCLCNHQSRFEPKSSGALTIKPHHSGIKAVRVRTVASGCDTHGERLLPAGSNDGRPYNADVEFTALLLHHTLGQRFGVGVSVRPVTDQTRRDVTDDTFIHPPAHTHTHRDESVLCFRVSTVCQTRYPDAIHSQTMWRIRHATTSGVDKCVQTGDHGKGQKKKNS